MAYFAAKLLNLRPGEGGRAALLCLFIFTTHACQVIGKVLQLSVFLDEYGRSAIPYAFLLSALVVTLVSIFFAIVARRISRKRLVPCLLGLISAGFLAWRLLVFGRVAHAAFILYVWVEAAAILAVILAWNHVNDACDSREGKRIFPLAALGASFAFLVNGFGINPLVRAGLPAEDLAFFITAALVAAIVVFYALEARYRVSVNVSSSGSEKRIRIRRPVSGEKGMHGEKAGFPGRLFRAAGRGLSQLAGNKLLRMFAVLTVFSILTQQFLDFVFMDALKSNYQKVELAAFMGTFMGALGGVQIILQLLVTGRFLNRFGGALSVLLQPVFIAAASVLFVVFPGFWVLTGLRFWDRALKTSFYSPGLQTLYTPVPPERKIQAMALIKGVVSPLAKVAGSLALLFFLRDMDPRWIVGATTVFCGIAAIYILVKAKKSYLEALHSALDRRKLSYEIALGEKNAPALDGTALNFVRDVVEKGPEGAAVFALKFLEGVHPAQARPLLVHALDSPFTDVRKEAVSLLADGGPVDAELIERKGLADKDEEVVLRALGSSTGLSKDGLRSRVEEFLADHRECVRVGAAVWLKRFFPSSFGDAGRVIAEFLGAERAETRRKAAVAIVEVGDESFSAEVKVLLYDPEPEVRSEALRAAGNHSMSALVEDVFLCFESRGPADSAERALEKLGDEAVMVLRRYVQQDSSNKGPLRRIPWVLSGMEGVESDRLLAELLHHDMHELKLKAARILARRSRGFLSREEFIHFLDSELDSGYRLAALQDAFMNKKPRSDGSGLLIDQIRYGKSLVEKRIMALVGTAVDLQTADAISANLESEKKRIRAGAVELLENIMEQGVAERLIPLFEGPVGPGRTLKLPQHLFEIYNNGRSRPVETIMQGDDVYMKAFLVHGSSEENKRQFEYKPDEEVLAVLPYIEKILFLKSAPMFSGLSGEELHGIASIAEEVSFLEGDVIFKCNDPGDAMYLVLHGEVSVRLNGREMVRLGAKECFGEMALLDNLPRSADVVALSDADLLRIDADSFDELLEQKHAIVKGIFKILTGRLRKANIKNFQDAVSEGSNSDFDSALR